MLYETKLVFRLRRLLKHDWWLFVEVPLGSRTGKMFKIDCVLVLAGATCAACHSSGVLEQDHTCMLAMEHDGTSHINAFPRKGSKFRGQVYQDHQDEGKEDVLRGLRIKLLQCWCSRVGEELECTGKNAWRQELNQAMEERGR